MTSVLAGSTAKQGEPLKIPRRFDETRIFLVLRKDHISVDVPILGEHGVRDLGLR
jgi:hypothetical protein